MFNHANMRWRRQYENIDVCKTLMPPFPQHINDKLDLSPTDLNINRGHLLMKDYLPTNMYQV